MKLNTFFLAASIAMGMASFAHAQTTVYMTGSSAMRSVVYNTLIDGSGNSVFTTTPQFTGYDGNGTDHGSCNYMIFEGTLKGGSGTTVINCHWSGSEAGIADVVSNRTQNFVIPAAYNHTDNGTTKPTAGQLAPQAVQLAMADNDQAFSRSRTPILNHGYACGIINFVWVRNPGKWTGANITDSMIQQALSGGCPRAVFSGNSADVNDWVYVSGRDNQSGTRVNALGTSGYGIFTDVQQIFVDKDTGAMQNQGSSTGNGYTSNSGQTSGGTLAKSCGANTTLAADPIQSTSGQGYSFIAYMGYGDYLDTAQGLGGVALSYDGIPFSAAAVKEGTYTFWGNEYIYISNNDWTAAGNAKSAYNLLADPNNGIQVHCDGTRAINPDDMHCSRTGPAAPPTHY